MIWSQKESNIEMQYREKSGEGIGVSYRREDRRRGRSVEKVGSKKR